MFVCPWGLSGLSSRVLSAIYSVFKLFSPYYGNRGLAGGIVGDIMVAPESFAFLPIWRRNTSPRVL